MTAVIQTPPPLHGTSLVVRDRPEVMGPTSYDMKSAPPTYPMVPFDMGVDLYAPGVTAADTASGIVRNAPYQMGEWRVQPSYERRLQCIIDLDTDTVWSSNHTPVKVQGWNPELIITATKRFKRHPDIRWLQCYRIVAAEEGNFLKFAIIINDFLNSEMVYAARRSVLESVYPQLGVRTMPVSGEMFLVPEFPDEMDEDVWAALHLMNDEWKRTFYDGLILRQATARFYYQKNDSHQRTLRAMHYPFRPTK